MIAHETVTPCFTKNRFERSRANLALSAIVIALVSAAMPPEADAGDQRAQAIAQYPKGDLGGIKLQRKDFRFGFDRSTAWLKRDGTWHIEAPVSHSGLLCSTYEVGMRFGIGKPDCTDVEWVSEARFVTSQTQCNNAEMVHSGTEIDESLTGQFDAISCGERVIRCSGNCK